MKFTNVKKIGVISDIHWGKSRDSQIKLKITEDYINWFKSEVKNKNLDLVIFCGDWFDNRNSIAISTMYKSYYCLKSLSEIVPVILIVGNHDTTLKRSIEINSLEHFKEIPNVWIVCHTEELELDDKIGLLCPWEDSLEGSLSKYDFMFGHFEFNGAALPGYTFSGCNINLSTLANISPLIFGGHFHIRKEYAMKKSKLITVGSPFELSWGDYQNTKGYYILDVKTRSYEFCENTISPKHIKYYWSKIKSEKEKILKKDVKGNWVRLVIDEKYDFEKIIKILNTINLKEPIKPCEPEYLYNVNPSIIDLDVINSDAKITMSKLEYIKKYLNKMDNEVFNDIDRQSVVDLIEQYYYNAEAECNET